MWFITRVPSTLLWGSLLFLSSYSIEPAVAFTSCGGRTTPPAKITASKQWQSRPAAQNKRRPTSPRGVSLLFESNDDDEPISDAENTNNNLPKTPPTTIDDNALLQRFLSPQIDDPGLPLTDILVAQIIAPTFHVYWLVLNRAPSPSWLRPISAYFGEAPELAPRGSLFAPTLIHGAGLAVCWLLGALAAKMFEREAFTVKAVEEGDLRRKRSPMGALDAIGRYDAVLVGLFKAGAFASGILIVSTQLDLLLEFKGHWVQYGESPETDLRLLVATVEVINDIVWEALLISAWRIWHANYMSSPDNRLRQF